MRRSRKSEYRRGVNAGMIQSFFNVTYLSIAENVEARKAIAIKSAGLTAKTWKTERDGLHSIEDAYFRGFDIGMNGWESDEEMNEVSRQAKLSVKVKQ